MFRQLQTAPLEFRLQRITLDAGGNRCADNDRDQVDQVSVAGGRVLLWTLSLIRSRHLVGHMIHQGIGFVSTLLDFGDDTPS